MKLFLRYLQLPESDVGLALGGIQIVVDAVVLASSEDMWLADLGDLGLNPLKDLVSVALSRRYDHVAVSLLQVPEGRLYRASTPKPPLPAGCAD